ncbi:hypothetical protein HYDPIDRAFT_115410 [Hydnomerulius pinastri MD-312]|uniref:Uncharacterized protein n=1 Tax=Hydnomerulius pinastri MD-312 TaxID=994086 RepID=A0A0C9WCU1_9AGAM|nr:hypothetical protein HYDPIDRAFT_115410 [Hydnomerulius pinastri MD-312]
MRTPNPGAPQTNAQTHRKIMMTSFNSASLINRFNGKIVNDSPFLRFVQPGEHGDAKTTLAMCCRLGSRLQECELGEWSPKCKQCDIILLYPAAHPIRSALVVPHISASFSAAANTLPSDAVEEGKRLVCVPEGRTGFWVVSEFGGWCYWWGGLWLYIKAWWVRL